MPRTRRPNFTADQKLKILRLHLLEKRPVSDLCDNFGFRPSQFHDWQKQFFENGAAAFARDGAGDKGVLQRTVEALESKLAVKNGKDPSYSRVSNAQTKAIMKNEDRSELGVLT